MTSRDGKGGAIRGVTLVAAAALADERGRVLLQRRPPGRPMAGLWEFPGGKIEPREPPETALVRELAEELGIKVAAEALLPAAFASHGYADFHLVMLLYLCRRWTGAPRPLHAAALKWARPGEMAALEMPPADLPLIGPLARLL